MDDANDISKEYHLQTVDTDIILSELNLSEEEVALTKSIILNIENTISSGIKNRLVVGIPNLGTLQFNNITDALRSKSKEIKFARQNLPKNEYREYIKDLRKDIKNDIKINRSKKRIYDKFVKRNKKRYITMVINYGKCYADLYIKTLTMLHDIIFDREIQDQYDKINGRYEE